MMGAPRRTSLGSHYQEKLCLYLKGIMNLAILFPFLLLLLGSSVKKTVPILCVYWTAWHVFLLFFFLTQAHDNDYSHNTAQVSH